MNSDHTASKEHNVCNLGYKLPYTEERADENCHELWEILCTCKPISKADSEGFRGFARTPSPLPVFKYHMISWDI